MSFSRSTALAAALLLAGCATLPDERGYADTAALLRARGAVAPDAAGWSRPPAPAIPAEPIDAEQAIALAFLHNPRIREAYARLGIARGELEDARRIANPVFGFSRLHGSDASPKITRSLSMGFTDLLLLPARKRFAAGELARVQDSVAAALLDLATEVEQGWYTAVAARQVADLRTLVARAAQASEELAQRYFDAGNIGRLQLEQERAAATEARIEEARALAAWFEARTALAALTGLPAEREWTVLARLPAPPATIHDAAALMPLALEQRLDLAAARGAVALREDTLRVARRWRWLGAVDVGFEQERDGTDGVSQGPTLSLELPIFNQGQGAAAKAQAEVVQARAALDALALSVQNDALLGVQRLNVAREVSELYRTALVPSREAIVARTQEQVDFMLVGVFELLRARREEFDAYRDYLEAVRDYWIARAELRRVVGGKLPDDGAAAEPTLGVDAVLPPATAPDAHHDHGGTP
jgi:cobalt-zinc-cadmium efflux system outer membrane protein